MVEIVWTDEALRWLHEIFDHVAAEDENAAHRLVSQIVARVDQLRCFPDSGALVDRVQFPGMRMLLSRDYRIVYRNSADRIEIIGVYHSALDLASRLAASRSSDTINE